MRSVHYSDVSAAARALLRLPEEAREAQCAQMMTQADWADRFVGRLGKLHPLWGNGTLGDVACSKGLAAEPSCLAPAATKTVERAWDGKLDRSTGKMTCITALRLSHSSYIRYVLGSKKDVSHGRSAQKTIRSRSRLGPNSA